MRLPEDRINYNRLLKNPEALSWDEDSGTVTISREHDKEGNAFLLYSASWKFQGQEPYTETFRLTDDDMTLAQFEELVEFYLNDYHQTANHAQRTTRKDVQTVVPGEDGMVDLLENVPAEVEPLEEDFRTVKNAEAIIKAAGLTEKQEARYRMSIAGKTGREIAKAEGATLKSVQESINAAKAKVEKAYNAWMNGGEDPLEAAIRQAVRVACAGCKFFDTATLTCSKHNKANPIPAEDALDNFGARAVSDKNGGFMYLGHQCWDCGRRGYKHFLEANGNFVE